MQTYRGLSAILNADKYAQGKTITWQQFSSATKKQSVASKSVAWWIRDQLCMLICMVRSFLERKGKKLSGSMFVIQSTKAKEIEELSVFPEEKETLFTCNSHFKV